MLNKTIRPVLSLVLVFCLLLGMSGNAIALAASNPVDDAIAQVDGEVNATIAELEQTIADLEKEVATQEKNLSDAKDQLESGKKDLAEAQKILDEKKELLKQAKEELDKLQDKLNEADEMLGMLDEKVAEYQAQLDDAQKQLDEAAIELDKADAELNNAWNQYYAAEAELDAAKEQLNEKQAAYDQAVADGVPAEILAVAKAELNDAKKQLNDASAELDNAKNQLTDAQNEKDAYQIKLNDAKAQLQNAKDQVEWAKGEYKKLYDTIDEISATMDNYQAKADEANVAVEKAEEALPKADKALANAKVALADAKTVLANVKATYATLYDAVINPEVSLDFVRDLVNTLNGQINAIWKSVLALQTSLHELIDAYEELEGFAIEPIVIEDYYFAGLTIEPFEVGAYHYDEVGFHFDGYKFDGYKVDPVTVEGYVFEGFTAPEMPAQLTELSQTLDDAIEAVIVLNEAVMTFVAAAEKVWAEALEMTEEALGITYDYLMAALNEVSAEEIYNWLYNNPEIVCDTVKEFGVHGLELMMYYGPYALELVNEHFDLVVMGMKFMVAGAYVTATMGAQVLGYLGDRVDFLYDYKDEVVDAARDLYEEYGDDAEALIQVYVEYLELEERYYNATHTQLSICCGTKYVAIGDTVFANNSYSQLLAADLYLKNYEALYAATVENAISQVAGNADIANADLITLSFGNMTAVNAMVEQMLGDGSYDPDWAVFGNEDVDDLVFKTLAELETELVNAGMDEETMAAALDGVEAFVYAYLEQQVAYTRLVNEIQAVNPDAKIVIVGAYNELKDMTIVMGDEIIPVGEYMFPMVCVANLQSLAEGFLNENVIYVDAHEVEMNNGGGRFDLNEIDGQGDILFTVTGEDLLPSEAGHAYIAEQIYNALNVEFSIWGDVNGDGKVNCRDARLILKYAACLITEDDLDLTWGDVNGDGKVNSRDARLILLLSSEQIEHFPVCNLSED